jgi:hypothetical protein
LKAIVACDEVLYDTASGRPFSRFWKI